MGVDTKLLVRPSIGANDIMTALKALGKTEVEYKATHTPEYAIILFKSDVAGWEKRSISFFYNISGYLGTPMNMLSLGHNIESVELFKQLANMIGGLFQEMDYDNTWEMVDVPGDGNIRWLLEQYFLRTPKTPSNANEQIEDFVNFNKKDLV